MNVQKRKRADSTLYCITVLTPAEAAAIQASIDERHRKPSYIEDDSDDSDVEQAIKGELEDSTLFWVQRKLIINGSEIMSLEKPTLAERTQRLTKQASKVIILLSYYISILILFLASRG